MKRLLFLFALPASLAAQQPADAGLRPVTLQEAITQAQQNEPAAIAARNAILLSKSGVRSAYGGMLPTLSFSMGQSQSSGPRIGPSGTIIEYVNPWSYSTGLSTQLTIFDGGTKFNAIAQNKANVISNEAAEVSTRFNIELSVKSAYYAVLQARESEAAANAQLISAREQLRVSEAQVAAGVKTRADSLTSAISVQNAQLAILQAQNTLKTQSAVLTRLIGSEIPVTADPADTLDRPFVVDSAMLAQLAITGPFVRQQEATLRSTQVAQRSSKARYFPQLSLSYGRNGSGFDKYFGIGGGSLSYSKSLSLNLSYTIFDGLTRENGVVNAAITEQNAEANLRDARLSQQQSLVTYLATLNSTLEQLRIQRDQIVLAEENLRVVEERYKVGAGVLLDVITAQAALNSARFNLIAIRFTYRNTKAQLEQLIGRNLGS
jgi:outer membrane protein